jgi:site-specific recombinase XerC
MAVQQGAVKTPQPRLEQSWSLHYWTLPAPSLARDHARLPPRPPPRNKGEQYPADPPTVEEIIAVMRVVGNRPDGHRLRALIVLLWRAGLRISEALSVQESDLDRSRGAVLVRRGKGRKARRTPLVPNTRKVLKAWINERSGAPTEPLFPTTTGKHLSRDAIERRLALHLSTAADTCPSSRPST